MFYMNPGNPDTSYLYQKVIAGGNIADGTVRMPFGCSGDTCLSDAEIKIIADFIDYGAVTPHEMHGHDEDDEDDMEEEDEHDD